MWGVPPYYRPHLVRHRRLATTEAADVYGLGHVLHELTFGRPLLSDRLERLPPDLMPELGEWRLGEVDGGLLEGGVVVGLGRSKILVNFVPPFSFSFLFSFLYAIWGYL